MNPSRLIAIWPCHSIEDFPTHYRGEDATGLLVSWTVLWHPLLIDAAGQPPSWRRHDGAEEDWASCLVTLPPPAIRKMPDERLAAIREHAISIEGCESRGQALKEISAKTDLQVTDQGRLPADAFFALGYAWLQIQLMTRQLRYSSCLDEGQWSECVVAAARHSVRGETDAAHQAIDRAYDLLLEEKNRYYPSVANLMDLTLSVPETDAKLIAQLDMEDAQNWLLSGSDAERIFDSNSELASAARQRIEELKLEIVGGSYRESNTTPWHLRTVIRDVKKGLETTERLIGAVLKVYGRRAPGLHPNLPEIATRLGIQGAFHLAFSGETIPGSSSPIFSWQGPGSARLPAIGAAMLDASQPESFLKLGVMIGEQIDSYHHAYVVFAHWPGQYCEFYEDFRAANRRGDLLGRFHLAREVFEQYYDSGYGDKFDFDDYRDSLLNELVRSGDDRPVSRFIDYWRDLSRLVRARRRVAIAELMRGRKLGCDERLEAMETRIEDQLLDNTSNESLDSELDALLQTANQSIAESLGLEISEKNDGGEQNFLCINVDASTQRHALVAKAQSSDTPIYTDVPPYSAHWGTMPREVKGSRPSGTKMIEENTIRNEFFTVSFHRETGAVQKVQRFVPRAQNILSQQLAMRMPGDADEYATMKGESASFDVDSETVATCRASGWLEHDGRQVASYRQQVSIERGATEIEFRVWLEPMIPLTDRPWQHYLASRLAWQNEGASRFRMVHGSRHRLLNERFIATEQLRIEDADEGFTLFPHGVPFHRQSTLRILDTLLIVGEQRARDFRFRIKIDVPQPPPESGVDTSDACMIWNDARSVSPGTIRLLKVAPDHLELVDMQTLENDAGAVHGVRVILQERLGQSGRFEIVTPRDLSSAHQIDLKGEFLQDIHIKKGAAVGAFHEHQLLCLQLNW
jgi:alpha-mannosidase